MERGERRPSWHLNKSGEPIGSKGWATHVMLYYLLGYAPIYINEVEIAADVLSDKMSPDEAYELTLKQEPDSLCNPKEPT